MDLVDGLETGSPFIHIFFPRSGTLYLESEAQSSTLPEYLESEWHSRADGF